MSNEETTPDRIPELAGFMKARHAIYLARRAGKPGPWTSDPVLANGRFCNVFRELDTVTIWIRKHIREPFADHPNLWLMLAIARYINWPPTLCAIVGDPQRHPRDRLYPHAWPDSRHFKPEHLTAALEDLASTGRKVYTGAYMIRAESDRSKPWYTWTKHRYIAEIVIGRLWEDRAFFEETLAKAQAGDPDWNALECNWWSLVGNNRYIGWGPFMAYEVITDMRHTRYLRNATDIMTWANAGPGAIRGLNRLHGRPLNTQPPVAQTCEEMRQVMLRMNADPELWPQDSGGANPNWPRLEMRDVEHASCEWDKAERVRLNEGKMRQKYDWRKARPLEL